MKIDKDQEIVKTLGDVLDFLIVFNKVSKKELASGCEVTVNYIDEIIAGNSIKTVANYKKIFSFLGVSYHFLLFVIAYNKGISFNKFDNLKKPVLELLIQTNPLLKIINERLKNENKNIRV